MMRKEIDTIKNKIDQLFYFRITDWKFDLENKTLRFELSGYDNDNHYIEHLLEFSGCSAICWIDDSLEPKSWDFCELSTIYIDNIRLSTEDKWLKHFPKDFNVAIEIWTTALLLKAKKITIDAETYCLPSAIQEKKGTKSATKWWQFRK